MMKRICACAAIGLAVLLSAAAAAGQTWTETTVTGTPATSEKHYAVYVARDGSDAAQNWPKVPLPPDQWHTINLNADVAILGGFPVNLPADAVAITIAGLVGSSGKAGVQCEVTAAFRAMGSSVTDAQVEAAAPVPGGAYRQHASFGVRLVNRKFQFRWHAADPTCEDMFLDFAIQEYKRVVVTIPAVPTLTAAPAGEFLTGEVHNGPGNALDWVGLCRTSDNVCIDWLYLNNAKTAPAAGVTETVVTFTAIAAGSYRLKLFRNDGYELLASSDVVVWP